MAAGFEAPIYPSPVSEADRLDLLIEGSVDPSYDRPGREAAYMHEHVPAEAGHTALIAAGILEIEAEIKAGNAMNVYGKSPSFPMPKYQSPLLAARV